MSQHTKIILIFILGLLLFILSLLADYIGIGSYPGMHWAQITGMIIGLLFAILGVYLLKRPSTKE